MRSVLRDYEAKSHSEKHCGKCKRVILQDLTQIPDDNSVDPADLEEALEKLRTIDDTAYQIVIMRFLGGMTITETASIINSTEWDIKKTGALHECGYSMN